MRVNYARTKNKKLKTLIDDALPRNGCSKWKRNKKNALHGHLEAKQMLDYSDRKVLIRITRKGRISYDYDNFVTGCKKLLDAIAAAICKPGDHEKDGVYTEYKRVTSEKKEIIVEVFEILD